MSSCIDTVASFLYSRRYGPCCVLVLGVSTFQGMFWGFGVVSLWLGLPAYVGHPFFLILIFFVISLKNTLFIILYMTDHSSYMRDQYLSPASMYVYPVLQCAMCMHMYYTVHSSSTVLLMAALCTSAMTNEDFKLQHLLCDEAMWWRVLGPRGFCMHIKAHNKYIYIHFIGCLRAP